MPQVKVRNLVKNYKNFNAVKSINFEAREGEFLTLLGPSGCGKTTTLRCIAGLERVDSGEIIVGNEIYSSATKFVSPEKRSLGMVFQSYAIWPHMTVFDNVAFGLKCHQTVKLTKKQIKEKTLKSLKLVSLEGLENRLATDISGGQQQRVALARSLVYDPPVLLLDEPLSNLDARLRDAMRFELLELHKKIKVTTIYVTHDQNEAMVLSDRIIIMNHGEIIQKGSPQEIYQQPVNRFIAEFLGLSNMLKCEIKLVDGEQNQRAIAKTDVGVDLICENISDNNLVSKNAYALLRPEHIKLHSEKPADRPNTINGVVKSVAYMGNFTKYIVKFNSHEFTIQIDAFTKMFERDENVVMSIDPKHVTLISDH